MKIPRPHFCSVVSPDEYDYIEQFKQSFIDANKFHKRVQDNPPVPYFALDMGKVYGLLAKIDEQAARIRALEEAGEGMAKFIESNFEVIGIDLVAAWRDC
jgi:hypothetical protein